MSVPKAEVVNALIEPVTSVLRSCAGVEAALSAAHLTTSLPPPPVVAVRIEIRGTVAGHVIWSFDLPLARRLAKGMLGTRSDAQMVTDTAAEVANIIAGNAVGLLEAAGHTVEIEPPNTLVLERATPLSEKALAFTFATKEGAVSMVLALTTA